MLLRLGRHDEKWHLTFLLHKLKEKLKGESSSFWLRQQSGSGKEMRRLKNLQQILEMARTRHTQARLPQGLEALNGKLEAL